MRNTASFLTVVLALVGSACGTSEGAGVGLTTTSVASSTTVSPYAEFLTTVEGGVFIGEIRDAEALVIGEVFTELMSDSDLVAAALALCEMGDETGDVNAVAEAYDVIDRFDWNMPAHESMVERILGIGRPTACSVDLPPVGLPFDAVIPPRPQDGIASPLGDVDALMQGFLDTLDGQMFIKAIRDEQKRLAPVFTETLTDIELVRLARGFCSTSAELGDASGSEFRLHQESRGWTGPADDKMFTLVIEASDAVCATVGS